MYNETHGVEPVQGGKGVEPVSIEDGKEFLRKTRISPEIFRKIAKESGHGKGTPQPPLELEYDTSKPLIKLAHPDQIETLNLDIKEAILRRRSVREYSEDPITFGQLTWLLYATQGVHSTHEAGTIWVTKLNNYRATRARP